MNNNLTPKDKASVLLPSKILLLMNLVYRKIKNNAVLLPQKFATYERLIQYDKFNFRFVTLKNFATYEPFFDIVSSSFVLLL